MDAIVDTTIVLHLFRRYEPALQWFKHESSYAVTSITWMETIAGSNSKASMQRSYSILESFEMLYLTRLDQVWAMQQLERFQFSHRIGIEDCLIASVAHRLQIPLYTHNMKHMQPLLGDLALKPYA